jgi:hypothetical protein
LGFKLNFLKFFRDIAKACPLKMFPELFKLLAVSSKFFHRVSDGIGNLLTNSAQQGHW